MKPPAKVTVVEVVFTRPKFVTAPVKIAWLYETLNVPLAAFVTGPLTVDRPPARVNVASFVNPPVRSVP